MESEVTEETTPEGSVEETQEIKSPESVGEQEPESGSRDSVARMSDEDLEKALAEDNEALLSNAAGAAESEGTAGKSVAGAPEAKSPDPIAPKAPGSDSGATVPVAETPEQIENARLKKQLADSQAFIARQAAEIGLARKGNPEEFIAKRKAIAEKLVSGTAEEVQEALREQRQLEQAEDAHNAAMAQEAEASVVVNVMQFVPNFLDLVPEMTRLLIEEDKVNPLMAQAAMQRPGKLGPVSTVFALAKRAEAQLKLKAALAENAVLKGEMEKLKKTKQSIVDGVNRAARQAAPLKAGGGAGSNGKTAIAKPVHSMTEAELEEILEGKTS